MLEVKVSTYSNVVVSSGALSSEYADEAESEPERDSENELSDEEYASASVLDDGDAWLWDEVGFVVVSVSDTELEVKSMLEGVVEYAATCSSPLLLSLVSGMAASPAKSEEVMA